MMVPSAGKISFNLSQTLNLTDDEEMSFKRTRKLLEQDDYQSFYKTQITMYEVSRQQIRKHGKRPSCMPEGFRV